MTKNGFISKLRLHRVAWSVFAIMTLFLVSGIHHLTQFETADEHYWLYERIPQYWHAVERGDWKRTAINDKPGVSLALVSGIGLAFEPYAEALCKRTPDLVYRCDTSQTESIFLAFRLPLLIINALLIGYLFWIIRKLSNTKTALWSSFLIASSPILIGISQIANPDALLWSFGAASFFSFFAALRLKQRKFTVFAGIFLGLSLLSKYTAAIFIPFFLLFSVIQAIFSPKEEAKETPGDLLKNNLFAFFLTIAIAVGIAILFLPAIATRPSILVYLLSGGSSKPLILLSLVSGIILLIDQGLLRGRIFLLLSKILKKLSNWKPSQLVLPTAFLILFCLLLFGRILLPDWDLFDRIPFDSKDLTSGTGQVPNLLESIYLELNPIVFSLTPIVLFFTLVTLFAEAMWSKKSSEQRLEVGGTIVFIGLFIATLIALDLLSTVRYLILLFPLFAFLAARGIAISESFVMEKFSADPKRARIAQIVFAVSVILASLGSLVSSRPFFFNYSNFLLPKNAIVSDAWGYGGYEAAQYLNSLPNAENLLIWSDYEGVCVFFKGRCMIKQYKYAGSAPIDYAVITRRGKILYNPDHSRWAKPGNLFMKPAYDTSNPDWSFEIDGRPKNFIKVVKVR